jgi:hypothetical protein
MLVPHLAYRFSTILRAFIVLFSDSEALEIEQNNLYTEEVPIIDQAGFKCI